MDWRETFSKAHPLNAKIKDTDVFLHGTSSNKYSAIQSKGFILRDVPERNYPISEKGICFERYVKNNVDNIYVIIPTVRDYCRTACAHDQSLEGVILQIKGIELKKLGYPIYVDWIKQYTLITDSEGIPVEVDTNTPRKLLSIIIVDRDIPFEYLRVVKRLPFKQFDVDLSPGEIMNFLS